MRKAYTEMQGEAEAVSQELKSLETEDVKITDAIDAFNSALTFANERIEKAVVMIKRANFLLSKAAPIRS